MSNYENFKNLLFLQLRANSNDYIKTIEDNKKIIENYLNCNDTTDVGNFVKDFNDVILEPQITKYKIFESVLKHKLFTKVLANFKESDILVKACKAVNKSAVEWLLTMNINYEIKDELGMTALMHAVEHTSLLFAVEKMMKAGGDHIHFTDINGNNVLFHATNSPDILKKLLKSKIDINHKNINNESLLLYCSRYDKIRSFEILCKSKIFKVFDVNLCNYEGKTTAMYLVENARFREVKPFVKNNNINPNYKNKFGDTLVSIYVKKFYQQYIGNIGEADYTSKFNYVVTKNYALTLMSLVDLKCDFNIPVDDDGNTPIMVFLMMKDYVTSKYLLDNCNIDLSIKNLHGINASYISLLLDNNVFERLQYNKRRNAKTFSFEALKNKINGYPTFDKQYKEDNDIKVHETIKNVNSYPIRMEYAQIAEQYILEVLFPNVGAEITLGGNTYRTHSFGDTLFKCETGGFGPY